MKNKEKLEIPLNRWPLFKVEERLSQYKEILQQELRDHGISFDFHLWVSDEWFCPDGVPGFALPFYLFNPELMKIHKAQTGMVEGTTEKQILKLMRHELGHAIENAFGLKKNPLRQQVFGSSSQNYPNSYKPRAFSKNYIHYLGDNYAQSHPDEDVAETFAYWLDPSKKWRLRSFSKKVTEKLNTMDRLMREVRNRPPVLKNKFRIDPIEKNTESLADFYQRFHQDRNHKHILRVDRNIRCLFSDNKASLRARPLSFHLRQRKQEICKRLSRSEGVYQYEAKWVLDHTIERADRLGVSCTFAEFKRKSPTLLQQNFRYLKEKDQLRFYL